MIPKLLIACAFLLFLGCIWNAYQWAQNKRRADSARRDAVRIAEMVAQQQAHVIRNVAYPAFKFQMTDATTHTLKTGLIDANFTTKQYSLAGASFLSLGGAVSEIGGGLYKIDLGSSEVDADTVMLRFVASGADETDLVCVTVYHGAVTALATSLP